ncbi:hypothetical protein D3C81_1171650 [compost metagenome]
MTIFVSATLDNRYIFRSKRLSNNLLDYSRGFRGGFRWFDDASVTADDRTNQRGESQINRVVEGADDIGDTVRLLDYITFRRRNNVWRRNRNWRDPFIKVSKREINFVQYCTDLCQVDYILGLAQVLCKRGIKSFLIIDNRVFQSF